MIARRNGLGGAIALFCAVLVVSVPTVAQKKKAASGGGGGGKAAAIAAVKQFEEAYRRKDRTAMMMRMMVPTSDAAQLEKRYQWYRGYGPKDIPGSAHPPILFDNGQGSFVPSSYQVLSAQPADGGRWVVKVKEQGTFRDEDGRWKIMRVRLVKTTVYKGKTYIMDYVTEDNPEELGFYINYGVDKIEKAN